MKQTHSLDQPKKRSFVTIFAIDLPASGSDGFSELELDNFYTPITQAVTSARKNGRSQLVGHPPAAAQDRPDLLDDWRKHVYNALRHLLDTIQLAGERLGLLIKWTDHGAAVITLTCGDPRETTAPAANGSVTGAGWDVHND